MKNIDINKDVAVCFDKNGTPLNHYGEIVPRRGFRVAVSEELRRAFHRAHKEIDK